MKLSKDCGALLLRYAGKAEFSVAPMMDYTNRHQRWFQRLLSKKTILFTEMVTSNAIVMSPNRLQFLEANFWAEEPLVLQLGGSNPRQMGEAARIACGYGYSKINVNVGCPSERVAGDAGSGGCFGAALMLRPLLVADICKEIHLSSGILPTVKCRIGVNEQDSYEELVKFIETVSFHGGVKEFIIHARKAILNKNFSTKDNRTIPPLKYSVVYQLVRDFPELKFTINGGIKSITEVLQHLEDNKVHGVMVGRAAVDAPFHWNCIDSTLFNDQDPGLSRYDMLSQYGKYAAQQEELYGKKLRSTLLKPIMNLFANETNSKFYRQYLSDTSRNMGEVTIDSVIMKAMEKLSEEVVHRKTVKADGAMDQQTEKIKEKEKLSVKHETVAKIETVQL